MLPSGLQGRCLQLRVRGAPLRPISGVSFATLLDGALPRLRRRPYSPGASPATPRECPARLQIRRIYLRRYCLHVICFPEREAFTNAVEI